MANTLMSLLVSLGIDSSEFQKGIGDAKQSVGDFKKNLMSTGQSMTKIGGAMTLGLTVPIMAFGASAVKSAMESENAFADVEATLKSTGSSIPIQELADYADQMQHVTKFSDEAVMASQGMLLTFTKIGKDVMPQATKATLNMATKFGMDASQAAVTLGKALNDPIAGVSALRRIGVMLTDEQKDQIQSFMDVGNVAGAQAIILKELEVELGGVAEAAGKTASGQFAIMNNELDTMKEKIGTALLPILLKLAKAFLPLIEAVSKMSPAMLGFAIAIAGIIAAAGPVIGTIGTLMQIFVALSGFLEGTAVVSIAAVGTAFTTVLLPLLLIIGTIGLVYYAFKSNFMGIGDAAKQLWFILGWVISNIVNGVAKVLASINSMKSAIFGAQRLNLNSIGVAGALANKPIVTAGHSGGGAVVQATNKNLPVYTGDRGTGGTNINVTVNNPVKEPAGNSIVNFLKQLSLTGIVKP